MKKILSIILFIISLFTFTIYFNTKKSYENNKIQQIETNIKGSSKILLPNELSNKSQDEVLKKIIESLKKLKGNIYYSRFDEGSGEYRKYIYLTSNEYLENLKTDCKEKINNFDMESTNFLSTNETNDSKQIGRIESFAGSLNLKVSTLKSLLEDGYLLDGYCTVNFENDKYLDLFIKDLSENLKIDKKDIQIIQSQNAQVEKSQVNISIILGMYFIVMLLILYDAIKSYKEIAVKKLMGFSNFNICFDRVLNLLKVQFFGSIIALFGISIFLFKEYNTYFLEFLFIVLKIWLLQSIIIVVISSLQFIYISNVKITNMLKNKQPINVIFYSNLLIKIIFLTLFIFLINIGWENYNRIENLFTDSYKKWDELNNYYSIPNLSDIDMNVLDSREFKENQKKLYKIFNKEGSILANFDEYIPSTRSMRIGETQYDYERDNVTVNPNYLNKYPIYDLEGNPIQIDEEEKDYIVLVPDKYKSNEKAITNMFESWMNGSEESTPKDRKIKIIWIKTGQKLFSINMDINANEDNCVENPLIRVLTESNGAEYDYDIIMGVSGNPFKIKVSGETNQEDKIRSILDEFGYSRYVKNISSINEEIASESNSVKELIEYLSISIVFLIIGIVFIIIQSIYTYFQQNKQLLAIRQLYGYKMLNKYKEYFIYFVASWFAIIIATITSRKIPVQNILFISFIGICVEIIVTFLIIKFSNSKKISNVIKGGI